MQKTIKKLQSIIGPRRILENEPMNKHTTCKIGGPAEMYREVDTLDDFIKTLKAAYALQIPVFVFGGGSNIIVSDKGIPGLVIKNNCHGFEIMGISGRVKARQVGIDKALVYAESGVLMNQLVRFTIDHGLTGLEYQLGLPGTVGGAVSMNAYFPQKQLFVNNFIHRVTILEKDGTIREVDKSHFLFRQSKNTSWKTEEVILAIVFKLLPMDKKLLWEKAMSALNYRNSTQPKGAAAGFVFRNITLTEAINASIPERITSAGFLIDRAGLKGKKMGNVLVSDTHANFIANIGDATASDVMQLVGHIKEEVYKKFKVELLLETRSVGFA